MPHGARLLYIDDDDALRRLTERALGRRGFSVSLAASGPEGVELAKSERFDVIAVDHYMPGQDGLQTLAQLSELPHRPPVVYVTGSEESRIAVAALKAGADDYVVKAIGEDYFDLLSNALIHALTEVRLRRGKEEAEAALRASNERLQTLLREVNHRVANSLQLVSAFVHMQASALSHDAAKAALEDTQRRIAAIAQVHKRLYTSDEFDQVAMDEYLRALLAELEETWSTPEAPRTVRLSAEPIKLGTDKAVSLGVIINELVSNACKYAYEPAKAGEIRVHLKTDGSEHFRLCVEDDGCGLPKDGSVRGTGLGSRLIRAMAQSLQSAVDYDPSHSGCRATLRAAY